VWREAENIAALEAPVPHLPCNDGRDFLTFAEFAHERFTP